MTTEKSLANRILRLRVQVPLELSEALVAQLCDAGALGVEEQPGLLISYPENKAQLSIFEQVIDDFANNNNSEDEVISSKVELISPDWHTTWLENLGPEQVSPRFVLRPVHCAPAPADEETLWYKPEVSFGSGQHATTRLAGSFIEEFLATRSDCTCFDVGTGSGVLSLVAARCGARSCLAVDIDPVSVKSAIENVRLNEQQSCVQVVEGSAGSSDRLFDLVIANINTPILHQLAPALTLRIARGGTLVLTGLLNEDAPDLCAAFERLNLKKTCDRNLNEWQLLSFSRPND